MIPVEDVAAGDSVVCAGPVPVDPFSAFNPVEGVILSFCAAPSGLETGTPAGAPLSCGVQLSMTHMDVPAATEMRKRLEAKYGPGNDIGVEFSCPSAPEKSQEFRLSYGFIGDRVWARMVIGYICSPAVSGAELFLMYESPLGVFRRLERQEEQEEAF